MKKLEIFTVAFTLLASTTFSQELAKTKNGKVLNPEAGDWGLSIDAEPFINLASDLVHIGAAAGQYAPLFNGLNGLAPTYSISGKYFMSSKMAYRGTIRLYTDNERTTSGITFDPNASGVTWPNSLSTDYKTKDVMSKSDWSIGLGGGVEWRKGTKRLQGYYGCEAIIAMARSTKRYNYEYDVIAPNSDNDFATLNDYTTNFVGNITSLPGEYSSRTLRERQAMTTALGIRGFVGVEFFVAPKISVGGEFGWGMGVSHTGRSSKKEEGVDFQYDDGSPIANGEVKTKVKSKSGDRSTEFFIGSDRLNSGASEPKLWMNSFSPAGKLSLNFYF